MSISGIEDEFRIAVELGIDRLIYILRPATGRDPRLTALVEDAKNSLTVAFYTDPASLYDRIRDDLTAVISSRFSGQITLESTSMAPGDLLQALLPVVPHRVRRPSVEAGLMRALERVHRIVVAGPFGSGKTVLLAQLAMEQSWVFVDARRLTGLEAVARCANALRGLLLQPMGTYPSIESACAALIEAWGGVDRVTLVVDAIEDGRILWDLFPPLQASPSHRLLMSSQRDVTAPSELRFLVPRWADEEIRELTTKIRGHTPLEDELRELAKKSQGSPLYVRFHTQDPSPHTSGSLKDLELRALEALEPVAREAATYLALAGRPLSLLDLRHLVGAQTGGVESLSGDLGRSSLLLHQAHGQVDLVHDHLRGTILEQLDEHPAKRAFLGARLAQYLTACGDHLTAFFVTKRAGDRPPSTLLTDQAAFQASLRGGGRLAVPVFEEQLTQARTWGDHTREVMSLVALAQVFHQVGDRKRTQDVLREARQVAEKSHDPVLPLRVKEVTLEFQLRSREGASAIAELMALREHYSNQGQRLDRARISLLLCAEYIDRGRYKEAIPFAREAMSVFTEVGDQYGTRIARLNLAAALIARNASDDEGLKLARELSESIDPDSLPRERAVVCNLLARRYRALDQPAKAEVFAREAIEIGEQLGDRRLIAINRINLGNSLRDQGLTDQALGQYRLADTVAHDAAITRVEASANELISSVLNERDEFPLALQHAQHAAGLAELSDDPLTLARAHEERAAALKGMGDIETAVDAYSDAAIAAGGISRTQRRFIELLSGSLSLAAKAQRPELIARSMTRVFGQSRGQTLQALCDLMPTVAAELRPADLVPIAALTFSTVLEGLPAEVERQVVLRVLRQLLDSANVEGDQVAAAVVGMLLASDWRRLAMIDLVYIAERLADKVPGLYFKPQSDGAAHWTLRVPLGQGIIVGVNQLDDEAWVASVALLIVMLFRVLAIPLRDSVVAVRNLPRRELQLTIVSHDEFKTHVPGHVSGLGDTLSQKFVISRAVDITRKPDSPTIVICRNDLADRWRPEVDGFSDVHFLFASLVEVAVSHLFAQEVEPEILHPKLGRIVRRIASTPS